MKHVSFSVGRTKEEGWRWSTPLTVSPTEAREDESVSPASRHVALSRIFMGLHTETVLLGTWVPSCLGGSWGELPIAPTGYTPRRELPSTVRSAETRLCFWAALGECNFPSRMFKPTGYLQMLLLVMCPCCWGQRLMRDKKQFNRNQSTQNTLIRGLTTVSPAITWSFFCPLLSRSCWKEIRKACHHNGTQKVTKMRGNEDLKEREGRVTFWKVVGSKFSV